ncbi:MAG: glycoside hydrolase family 113 [Flavobacteriales bacterium]
MKYSISLFLLQVLVFQGFLSGCHSTMAENRSDQKKPAMSNADTTTFMRGLSFVGSPDPCTEADFDSVLAVGADCISLMPFAYVDSKEAKLSYQNLKWQWWGESPQGVETCIQHAKAKNISCMIKPQLWIDHGMFTGIFDQPTDEAWKKVEENYTSFILQFATLSEKHTLPVFCIATELDTWASKRPDYWRNLIVEIRKVYKGRLVYACNWDAYRRIPFWSELDFVGIDAYFPLSEEMVPTLPVLQQGWEKLNAELSQLADSLDKKILFTEWGYQAREFATRDPWIEDNAIPLSEESQAACYEALLSNCSKQSWWAGGFVWKWFPHNGNEPSQQHERFSPQNRKALQVLEKHFKQ